MMASIFATAVAHDVCRRRVDRDRRHQRPIQLQVDGVELALPRREPAVRRKHARHVRLVVLVVGRVVELHEVAVAQRGGVPVVVRVVRVRAGRDQREVRGPEGAALREHELGVRLQLVLGHARPRVAHRLHDAEPGEARGLADERDLARALHRAHRVEHRIEILQLRARRRGAQLLPEHLLARRAGRPTDPRPCCAPGSTDRPTTGCRAPRRGTACRWCVRRACRRRARTPRAAARRRCRWRAPPRRPARAPGRTCDRPAARSPAAGTAWSSACGRRAAPARAARRRPVR